jgi:hypothetical protein
MSKQFSDPVLKTQWVEGCKLKSGDMPITFEQGCTDAHVNVNAVDNWLSAWGEVSQFEKPDKTSL